MHWYLSRAWFRQHRRRIVIGGAVMLGLVLVLFVQPPGRIEAINSYQSCADAGYPITQTNPPVCRAPHKNFTGAYVPDTAGNVVYRSQPYAVYVNGDLANGYPRGQHLITSQAEWEDFWKAVHANLAEVPPILNVDFAKNDVLALVNGEQPTQGYTLKVTAVLTSAAGSMIDVSEQFPAITCHVEPKSSNRYYIATTAKLTQPVSFRLFTTPRTCQP